MSDKSDMHSLASTISVKSFVELSWILQSSAAIFHRKLFWAAAISWRLVHCEGLLNISTVSPSASEYGYDAC